MPPYYALPELRRQSEEPPFPLPQTPAQPVAYLPLSDPQPADIEASLAALCDQNDYAVYSSHIIEDFSGKLRNTSEYVKEDISKAKHAGVYVGITDGSISNGMAVKIAVAAAYKTRIILLVRTTSPHVAFLEEVVRAAPGGVVIEYPNANCLVEKLRSELHLTKGRDPKDFHTQREGGH